MNDSRTVLLFSEASGWGPFVTVITGVLVFILGQIALKMILEPVQELRRLRGELAQDLNFFANQIHGRGQREAEARETFRKLACRIRELLEIIPKSAYGLARFFNYLPDEKDLTQASSELIALSNSQPGDAPHAQIEAIKKLLQIRSY